MFIINTRPDEIVPCTERRRAFGRYFFFSSSLLLSSLELSDIHVLAVNTSPPRNRSFKTKEFLNIVLEFVENGAFGCGVLCLGFGVRG